MFAMLWYIAHLIVKHPAVHMNLITNNRPTIMMLITKADTGGAQIHVLTLIRHLKDRFQFVLVCGEEGFLTNEVAKLSVEIIIVAALQRKINLKFDYAALSELRELFEKRKPDIVHTHSSKAGVLGRIAARKSGSNAIFTAHGWAFTEGAGFLQRSYGLIVEWLVGRLRFDVIAVSE